jgi:hypothetical protein
MVVNDLPGVGVYNEGIAGVEFPIIPYEAVKPCDGIRPHWRRLPMPLNMEPWLL